jgi:hypothetical protein
LTVSGEGITQAQDAKTADTSVQIEPEPPSITALPAFKSRRYLKGSE